MLGIEKKNKGENVGALHQNLLVGEHKIEIMAFIHQSVIIAEVMNFNLQEADHVMNTLQPDRWMQWLFCVHMDGSYQ